MFTSCVHIFAGQADPVRPFLQSDLPDIPKATLLACWHMVSVTLVLGGGILTVVGWVNPSSWHHVVIGISSTFILFSLVFLGVGWFFFKMSTFIKLPQWGLLLLIGILGVIGGVQT